MTSPPERSSAYFDGWYADMDRSPVKDEIEQRHLGLPPYLLSTSMVTWDAIAEVVEALRLQPGDVVLDLACGRGGYGLEVAARTTARLVGVDFSAEAVRQARRQADLLSRAADFRVGDLVATGLDDGSVQGVLCIDAVQFAVPPEAAYAELQRVLAPGGRAVLTCWEALDPSDERLPERLRTVDLGAGLAAAGFVDVDVRERPTGTPSSTRCGPRPPGWTPPATLPCSPSTTRACGRWPRTTSAAGSWPQPPPPPDQPPPPHLHDQPPGDHATLGILRIAAGHSPESARRSCSSGDPHFCMITGEIGWEGHVGVGERGVRVGGKRVGGAGWG